MKAKGSEKMDKMKAQTSVKVDKYLDKAKKGLESTKKGLYNSPTKMFDAGAAAAQGFKDNADVIYQVFYSVAIFIVICIVAIPSVALLVIGIICYFLLKNKMKTIKSL